LPRQRFISAVSRGVDNEHPNRLATSRHLSHERLQASFEELGSIRGGDSDGGDREAVVSHKV
jgi:hypothetical protein